MNEALKSLRGKKLKTQEDMSEMLNISRQTYCNYENNVASLEIQQIIEILNVLEATPEEIKEFFYTIQRDILSK